MKNFKSSVPEALQNKIKEVADVIDFGELVSGWQQHGFECEQHAPYEIEGNYVSGWMPNQDGGFGVSQWCQNDEDSSYHFTEKQTEYNNEQSKACYDSFLEDNDLDADTDYGDLSEEQKESLYEYERSWFDSALLDLQIFVDGFSNASFPWHEDRKQITMRLSINYKDAPYYREKYGEDIKVEVFDIEEFMEMPVEQIVEKFRI